MTVGAKIGRIRHHGIETGRLGVNTVREDVDAGAGHSGVQHIAIRDNRRLHLGRGGDAAARAIERAGAKDPVSQFDLIEIDRRRHFGDRMGNQADAVVHRLFWL